MFIIYEFYSKDLIFEMVSLNYVYLLGYFWVKHNIVYLEITVNVPHFEQAGDSTGNSEEYVLV